MRDCSGVAIVLAAHGATGGGDRQSVFAVNAQHKRGPHDHIVDDGCASGSHPGVIGSVNEFSSVSEFRSARDLDGVARST
jgi:hypothetical protein